MKNLILSEWERIWARKVIFILLFSTPFLVLVTGIFFNNQNTNKISTEVDYATTLNFPILSISEHLFITFNILILFLAANIVTEEYQTGQLKLILLRSYNLNQIFFIKVHRNIYNIIHIYFVIFYILINCWFISF